MAKGYWIVFYRSVSNPAAVAQYAKPAEAAILAGVYCEPSSRSPGSAAKSFPAQ